MNVLICIPCLLVGGTEVQTLNLARALSEGGHKVIVACYFEHCPQMIKTYKQVGATVELFSADGIRVLGWKVVPFLYKALRRVVKAYKPQVIHVQYMAPGALPILILKALGVKNILATAHTAADIYPDLRMVHFIQRHITKVWTCITCKAEESFFGSSMLFSEQTKLGKHDHCTIYNALPKYIEIVGSNDRFANDSERLLTIGVVSRLEEIKGMDLVVPAFAKVHAKHGNTRLLVVGDGSLHKLMEKQVIEYVLTNAVTFVGRQGQETLQGYYDKIDVLLMPSRSEGFGLTAIEGMARGCVVVAANVGGLSEVVKDGEVGLLHKEEDVDDIAFQVHRLIGNPDLLRNLSNSSLKYVSQYSYEEYAYKFNSLYSKI